MSGREDESGVEDDGDRDEGGGSAGLEGVRWRVRWWRVRWWRSLGFWMGAWGLAFLVWVWMDSYWKGAQVESVEVVMQADGGSFPYEKWAVQVQRGMLIFRRGRLVDPPADLVVSPERVVFYRGRPLLWRVPRSVLWGSMTEIRDHSSILPDEERTSWWLSMGFVVLGYAGAWWGLTVLWRRWMRRRWGREKASIINLPITHRSA
ncbi:hypothetical protein [Luteolibacter soli]|uniref:DUF3592 domain-containing protein n=1 Tax=Luteolibacter soli TaxID=3135280 RepID=A0ABU9AVX5_9BACT